MNTFSQSHYTNQINDWFSLSQAGHTLQQKLSVSLLLLTHAPRKPKCYLDLGTLQFPRICSLEVLCQWVMWKLLFTLSCVFRSPCRAKIHNENETEVYHIPDDSHTKNTPKPLQGVLRQQIKQVQEMWEKG